MAVLPKNKTFSELKRAADLVLRKSSGGMQQVRVYPRAEALTLEPTYASTGTISSLPATVQFSRGTLQRPSGDRWRETLLTIPNDDGVMHVHCNRELELCWCVAAKTNSAYGADQWKTTLELSTDEGVTWTAVDIPTRSYGHYANKFISIISPIRKLQGLLGDRLRLRLDSEGTGGAGTDNYTIGTDSFFHIRTL